jgi:lipopolysaccharide/colanic/teichoic acid biosynthesis glycosyltransferase
MSLAAFRQSPIFSQKRIGRDGREFVFYKLRSLPGATPTSIDKFDLEPHLTRWGRILRRSKLDELPQLVNVLRGDMSLVGPRPEVPELNTRLDGEFSSDRTMVRPGITGPWQVSDTAHLLIGDGEEYDRAYLAAASPGLDVWLIWRTFATAAGRKISLEDLGPWIARAERSEGFA